MERMKNVAASYGGPSVFRCFLTCMALLWVELRMHYRLMDSPQHPCLSSSQHEKRTLSDGNLQGETRKACIQIRVGSAWYLTTFYAWQGTYRGLRMTPDLIQCTAKWQLLNRPRGYFCGFLIKAGGTSSFVMTFVAAINWYETKVNFMTRARS